MKAPSNLEEWLTVADVAKMLRFSRKRIYHMIQRHELPAYKFGPEYRIRRGDFEQWLETRKVT